MVVPDSILEIILNCWKDGSCLIAASSTSNDGNITGNHSSGTYTDGVLMKIDAAGNIIWSKCFGGTKNEELFDIEVINGIHFCHRLHQLHRRRYPTQSEKTIMMYGCWRLTQPAIKY